MLTQDSNSSGNLLASVEDSEQVDSSRIVWCFTKTKEEAGEEKTYEVLAKGSKTRDQRPQHHCDSHVSIWASASQDHVARNLTKNVANKQNADAGLIF